MVSMDSGRELSTNGRSPSDYIDSVALRGVQIVSFQPTASFELLKYVYPRPELPTILMAQDEES